MFGAKKTITWSSSKTSSDGANRELAKEIEKMAKKGYVLQTSSFSQAGHSKKAWVTVGLINLIRAKQVQATAIFVLAPEPPVVQGSHVPGEDCVYTA
jgi:surfactin synthase thioesterase subunit